MAKPGHAFYLASLSFEIIALVRTSLRHKYRLCSVLTHLFFLRNHRAASNSTLIDFTGAVRRLCESSQKVGSPPQSEPEKSEILCFDARLGLRKHRTCRQSHFSIRLNTCVYAHCIDDSSVILEETNVRIE